MSSGNTKHCDKNDELRQGIRGHSRRDVRIDLRRRHQLVPLFLPAPSSPPRSQSILNPWVPRRKGCQEWSAFQSLESLPTRHKGSHWQCVMDSVTLFPQSQHQPGSGHRPQLPKPFLWSEDLRCHLSSSEFVFQLLVALGSPCCSLDKLCLPHHRKACSCLQANELVPLDRISSPGKKNGGLS